MVSHYRGHPFPSAFYEIKKQYMLVKWSGITFIMFNSSFLFPPRQRMVYPNTKKQMLLVKWIDVDWHIPFIIFNWKRRKKRNTENWGSHDHKHFYGCNIIIAKPYVSTFICHFNETAINYRVEFPWGHYFGRWSGLRQVIVKFFCSKRFFFPNWWIFPRSPFTVTFAWNWWIFFTIESAVWKCWERIESNEKKKT